MPILRTTVKLVCFRNLNRYLNRCIFRNYMKCDENEMTFENNMHYDFHSKWIDDRNNKMSGLKFEHHLSPVPPYAYLSCYGLTPPFLSFFVASALDWPGLSHSHSVLPLLSILWLSLTLTAILTRHPCRHLIRPCLVRAILYLILLLPCPPSLSCPSGHLSPYFF